MNLKYNIKYQLFYRKLWKVVNLQYLVISSLKSLVFEYKLLSPIWSQGSWHIQERKKLVILRPYIVGGGDHRTVIYYRYLHHYIYCSLWEFISLWISIFPWAWLLSPPSCVQISFPIIITRFIEVSHVLITNLFTEVPKRQN